MPAPADFFQLGDDPLAAELFDGLEYVWEALERLRVFFEQKLEPNVGPVRERFGDLVSRTTVLHQGRLIIDGVRLDPGDATKGSFGVSVDGQALEGATLIYAGASIASDEVELSPGAVVEPGAMIKGPTRIGPRTEVRQGAYLRGNCLVGAGCVVGHVTEVKTAVFLDGAKAGHFAYVGDSILGRGCNLGAGTKLANLKIVEGGVDLKIEGKIFRTGLRKLGAIIGDGCELGCNSVTNPGVLLGPRSLVAPNSTVSPGYYRARSVIRPPRSVVR
ncbi:MAG: glucose-1-phosphate thymidylyltransferase [Proteobacteria bacterium]|nr:glucose-1-phosphate thymidylyltransferase [Pseudomonadota bacterium]MBU1743151.1 glucose-1-phosphate thymidylyltransferase [Pseudomonadota bacterium]